VTKNAPLPDAQSVFMNPDLKVYDTDVMIEGVHPQLRTGMSCQATILIEDHLDAIAVPMQSVVGRGGESVVYVVNGNEATPRKVVTGLDNKAMIHIVDGLTPGEQVLLVPPLSEDIKLPGARGAQGGAQANNQSSSGQAGGPARRASGGTRP
jgi:HlyD family secretion protein